jgi:hypothetical protein
VVMVADLGAAQAAEKFRGAVGVDAALRLCRLMVHPLHRDAALRIVP